MQIPEISNIREIYGDLKEYITDKYSSPFAFPFLVAWIFSNYKFFLILTADVSLSHLFKLLDWYFYTPTKVNLIFIDFTLPGLAYSIFFPLVITLLYVFIYPAFSIVFSAATLYYKITSDSILKKILKLRIISKEELDSIHDQYEKFFNQQVQQIASLRVLANYNSPDLVGSYETLDSKNQPTNKEKSVSRAKVKPSSKGSTAASSKANTSSYAEADIVKSIKTTDSLRKANSDPLNLRDQIEQQAKQIREEAGILAQLSSTQVKLIELLGKNLDNNVDGIFLESAANQLKLPQSDMKHAIVNLLESDYLKSTPRAGGLYYYLSTKGLNTLMAIKNSK